MKKQNRYDILPGLPSYGPMYIPVSEDGEQFYSEGFVVRFYKSDGTEWVANFKPGWSLVGRNLTNLPILEQCSS